MSKQSWLEEFGLDDPLKKWTGLLPGNLVKHGVIDKEVEQGFLDNKGKFLNRVQAMQHAFNCGQIKTCKKELFSEDLY